MTWLKPKGYVWWGLSSFYDNVTFSLRSTLLPGAFIPMIARTVVKAVSEYIAMSQMIHGRPGDTPPWFRCAWEETTATHTG